MKKSKTELVSEVAVLESKMQTLRDKDERLRIEFSKAFSWKEPQDMYSVRSHEPRTPTWEEVFVEVGKLLAARTFYDLEGNVSELECKIEDLEKRIRSEIHPNL